MDGEDDVGSICDGDVDPDGFTIVEELEEEHGEDEDERDAVDKDKGCAYDNACIQDIWEEDFQIIEMESARRRLPLKGCQYKYTSASPSIVMYCRAASGATVCINTFGYKPIVHLLTSSPSPNLVEIAQFVEDLLTKADAASEFPRKKYKPNLIFVTNTRLISGYPAFPFTPQPLVFVEITLALPEHIKVFGTVIRAAGCQMNGLSVSPYSCLDFIDKFTADTGVRGFGWIHLPRDKRTILYHKFMTSRCECEIICNYQDIAPIEKDDIAPIRVLSFDIECAKSQGLPNAERDPIILIASICSVYIDGSKTTSKSVILQDGVANPKLGDDHRCYREEGQMIEAFGKLVYDFDPDFLIGHNICGFDIPYIVERSAALQLSENCQFIGRRGAYKWRKPRIVIKKRKNGETRSTKVTDTPGRIQLDTLPWIQAIRKERSYKLGSLGEKYLGQNKEDVGYLMIVPLWKTSDETRSRLAQYCLKDTEIAQGLADLKEFSMVMSCIEMSRQTRVCAGKLLRSGVQVKVWGLLAQKAKAPGFDNINTPVFFPDEEIMERAREDKFQGAEVLEPKRGYYERFVGCGDFQSLYPSIIIDLNICYTTEMLNPDSLSCEFRKAPTGVCFVNKFTRIGLLPQIEKELLALRAEAKKMVGLEKDVGKKRMYDSRQNEIKIICNSIYGFMTASGGKFTRMELGEAVTAQGRCMIMQSKAIAESDEHGCLVIYGDTDSIFMLFPSTVNTLELAFGKLKQVCDAVTASFPPPIKLQPEKVMTSLILINKKRYISALHLSAIAPCKIDTKGVETARRDNCRLVVKCMNEVITRLLIDKDKQGAINVVNSYLKSLLMRSVEMADLVITQAITKEKYAGKVAHVEVARRMAIRDPSYAVGTAERIPYVIIENGKTMKADKAEDPLWVIQKGLPLDIGYYVHKQLAKPVSRILMWVFGDAQHKHEIEKAEDYVRYVRETHQYRNTKDARKVLQKAIDNMQQKTVEHFFGSDALKSFPRMQHVSKTNRSSLDFYVIREVHKRARPEDIEELMCQAVEAKIICDKCRGYTDETSIKCVQRDCPNLYHRAAIAKKIEEEQE